MILRKVGPAERPVLPEAEPPIVVTPELALAYEFLGTLTDLRAPWIDRFNAFAAEKRLPPDVAGTVKADVLRLRMFAAVQRHARRRRP